MKLRIWHLVIGLTSIAQIGATETRRIDVHEVMSQVIARQAQVIWDVGNAAQDNNGNVDASRVSQTQWDQVLTAARELKRVARALASADRVIVAAPGVKIQNEGTDGASDAKAVQRYVDANPKTFRSHARTLEAASDKLIVATSGHDGASYSRLSSGLDEICENCHKVFWYPQESEKK